MRLILVLSLLLSACNFKKDILGIEDSTTIIAPQGESGLDGSNGVDGINGNNGVDGSDGIDGAKGLSIENTILTVFDVERDNGPWTNFVANANYDGLVEIPVNFVLNAFPDALRTNGTKGWITIDVVTQNSTHRFCYVRTSNSKQYTLSYKKLPGILSDCSANNDKLLSTYVLAVELETGDEIFVLPNDPHLAATIFDFEFVVREEK